MDSTENSISVKFVNRDLLTFSSFFNKRMALVVLKAAFLHLKVRYEAFFNIGRFRPLFRLFSSSSHSNSNFNIINWKNCRCLLGIRTLGRRVIDADETTELWRHLMERFCRAVYEAQLTERSIQTMNGTRPIIQSSTFTLLLEPSTVLSITKAPF